VAVAGIKLSQTDPIISAFAEGYSRLVIYPSRSLEIIKNNIKDPKELVAEMMRGSSINRTAMKTLSTLKHQGKLVLVFPAGTRFRPWDPSSKRGVREIDSYLKSFDYMCLVAVKGNLLRINPEGIMREDLICPDRVLYDISEPLRCDEFRDSAKHHKHFGEDKKQAIVDSLMASLEAMHDKLETSVEP
jgi:glycerol-3-phosphate O-acyltransferase